MMLTREFAVRICMKKKLITFVTLAPDPNPTSDSAPTALFGHEEQCRACRSISETNEFFTKTHNLLRLTHNWVSGHSHPAVTAAVAEQMALLNTNSRYLHPNMCTLAERILAKCPPPLTHESERSWLNSFHALTRFHAESLHKKSNFDKLVVLSMLLVV